MCIRDRHLDAYRVVVNKSTVPVGTADVVRDTIAAALAERGLDIPFSVVSNPEFLKEGAAIPDFMRPDRIIVGCDDHRATVQLRALYAPFNRNRDRLIEMDVRSAELTKYAANAMLATKISFMNEIANLAERLGADIEKVRVGIGADPRIGYHFIYPGAGYGGSCFPKDVKALEHTARSIDYEAALLQAVEAVNERQKNVLFTKIQRHFKNQLRGRTFALWGSAFKPGTDDMREAPSRNLLEALWKEGCTVRAYDPAAMNEARRIHGERPDFQLCAKPMDALTGADALIIVTEWSVFRSPDFDAIRQQLKQRRESLAQFQNAGRADLAAQENFEIDLIQSYLPAPLAEADLDALIADAIAATGAQSVRDMGKVMALIKDQAQGRADLAAVSARVKARFDG